MYEVHLKKKKTWHLNWSMMKKKKMMTHYLAYIVGDPSQTYCVGSLHALFLLQPRTDASTSPLMVALVFIESVCNLAILSL